MFLASTALVHVVAVQKGSAIWSAPALCGMTALDGSGSSSVLQP